MNLAHFKLCKASILNRSIFLIFESYSLVFFLIYSHRMNQILTGFTKIIPVTVSTNKNCIFSLASFTYSFLILVFFLYKFMYNWILVERIHIFRAVYFWALRAHKSCLFYSSTYCVKTTRNDYRVFKLCFPFRIFKLSH